MNGKERKTIHETRYRRLKNSPLRKTTTTTPPTRSPASATSPAVHKRTIDAAGRSDTQYTEVNDFMRRTAYGQDKWLSMYMSCLFQLLHRICFVTSFVQFFYPTHISTHCRFTVSLEMVLQPTALILQSDICGVVTPSLMPPGPDAQHLLDTCSLSYCVCAVVTLLSVVLSVASFHVVLVSSACCYVHKGLRSYVHVCPRCLSTI